MPYDPSQPYLSGMQYVNVEDYLSPELHARVEKDVITICKALGYDLNTVEFAIKDGIPYAIDFMNPAPDAELASVGEANHKWIVDAMTEFIFKKLEAGFRSSRISLDFDAQSECVEKRQSNQKINLPKKRWRKSPLKRRQPRKSQRLKRRSSIRKATVKRSKAKVEKISYFRL